ncbi:MAG TPA: hypothetical protein VM580_18745 [Labilithrix sp.]|nr:hypothetical protein [Labilithrix sp.]
MSTAPKLDDDDATTTVMDRPVLAPASGMRVSVAESTRDTIVDPPSPWLRLRAVVGSWGMRLRAWLRGAHLSDRLPPLPPPRAATSTQVSAGAVARDERGEQLLLDIMQVPAVYQSAAIYIANYAAALRKLGDDAYAEGLVHLALSRMHPDRDGCVSIARLRDRLPEASFSGTLMPALLRLEASGIVALTSTIAGDERGPGRARFDRVRLRVQL